jgi:hypothetical protein
MVFKIKIDQIAPHKTAGFFVEEAWWFFQVSEITKTDGAKICF